ncbi:hypothetical protein [Klebsiella huaxiensis]|uniref:Lipoprotein n=1 Tax=Klebsiella huaxiensis TaxID=2153354 RepID=A0ABT6EDJ2_9ENTR|nr:hypothetical protein [Klebsiella huaxiensis]MDG1643480.1 hypothetical protein [Klebsiella huaxiensis]
MNRVCTGIAIAVLSFAVTGCASKKQTSERVGDLVFVYNQANTEVAKKEADTACGGKSYYIGYVRHGYSGKPGSMRIPFACTQKAALDNDSYEAKEEVRSEGVKEEMRRIAAIPWSGTEANRFFLKETHYFMLLECGWAGTVGFATGKAPTVLLGSSYYPGESATFKNGQYKIIFNGGSMAITYNPQLVKGAVLGGHSFTPCSVVRLGEEEG